MSSPSPGKRRMDTDVMKLYEKHEVWFFLFICSITRNKKVNLTGDSLREFVVKFYGPKETPYEGGVWRIKVELPDKYPFKSPR